MFIGAWCRGQRLSAVADQLADRGVGRQQDADPDHVAHQAHRVVVRLAADDGGVRLDITDDGGGFATHDGPPGGYGMASMRERAELIGGTLRVRARPGWS